MQYWPVLTGTINNKYKLTDWPSKQNQKFLRKLFLKIFHIILVPISTIILLLLLLVYQNFSLNTLFYNNLYSIWLDGQQRVDQFDWMVSVIIITIKKVLYKNSFFKFVFCIFYEGCMIFLYVSRMMHVMYVVYTDYFYSKQIAIFIL